MGVRTANHQPTGECESDPQVDPTLSHVHRDATCTDAHDKLRQCGVRRTRQREVVYEALASCTSHPTAEELHERVKSLAPGLSLATVYNALDVFTEVGLCRRIPGPGGGDACRFDADVRPHAHITLHDGRVLDVPHDLSERLLDALPAGTIRELEQRLGVSIRGVSLGFTAATPRPQHGG